MLVYCAPFVVLTFGLIICSCAVAQTYDVYPEETCQGTDANVECLTLSDVLIERDKYFTSNSTLFFHKGEHILQGGVPIISVSNISNFTLQGYSGSVAKLTSPKITCATSSLSLSDVSIRIISITFNYCSISLTHTAAVVEDCSFENGTTVNHGGALAIFYSSVQFNGTNSFAGNTARWHGGAIYAHWSNLTFCGGTAFSENKVQRRYGGAVYAMEGNILSFNGNNSFVNNIAEVGGGAVYVWDSNCLSFNGNSTFTSNTAGQSGGAVCMWDSNSMSFDGNSSFMNNTAGVGSVVYTGLHNTLSFNRNSSFLNNTADFGGAVYGKDNNSLSFNGNSAFMNNTAVFGGGAVYTESGNTLSFNRNSIFLDNIAAVGGAVYVVDSNSFSFNGNSTFMNNTAVYAGGAVYTECHNTVSFNGNSSFMNNTAVYEGGAVYIECHNTLSFSENSIFMSNRAGQAGGVLLMRDSNILNFSGSSSFVSNTAVYAGGVVHTRFHNTLSFNGNSSFMNNSAGYNGGVVHAFTNNTFSFDGSNSFLRSTAGLKGGAVYLDSSNTLSFNGNTSFFNNTAELEGGAVSLYSSNTLSFDGSTSFINNTAELDGGAVYVVSCNLSFYGNSVLEHNEATRGGGIALFSNSLLHLYGIASLSSNVAGFGGAAFVQDSSINSNEHITVARNKAIHGGGLFVQYSDIVVQGIGWFSENTVTSVEGGYGGAIFARSSAVTVEYRGSLYISNNTAEYGGGLAFFGGYNTVLVIKDSTSLSFEGNLAHRRGGAIYVEDDPFTFCTFDSATESIVGERCFFQMKEGPYYCFEAVDTDPQLKSITLKLDNNIANVSGDNLYGGNLESCGVCSESFFSQNNYTLGAETFHRFAEFDTDGLSKLSSDPYKVCICENNNPNCDLRVVNRTVYPGQVIATKLVAVGQMNGTVPSVIRAVADGLIGTPSFLELQPAENIKECSQLQYPLSSTMSSSSLKLYSDEPCSTSGYPLILHVNFLSCPVGFNLSEEGECICDERLQMYTQNCSIQDLTISRDAGASFWVGTGNVDRLILHPHCPFDYCVEDPVSFTLNRTDSQCANGRSGILCGACQQGRSLALSSSRCLPDCSNAFLALLFAFACAGVVLVAFLFLCHLTVAEGTLSGLIFYANVLAVNKTVFFPPGEQNPCTVFIAWLNLDIGIETCFFVGLDAYYRTWLQFSFPVYIWVIVGVIIILADRTVCFAKIIGSTNPVAVLATLFLLSYTKLLRAIMAAFSFTTLDYPDGDKYVWLYDGNVGYLDRHDGRHIGLFLFSLLFVFVVSLPYTLLLLCGQWIQKQLWWLSSTKQLYLKSFLDAYYGPYKIQHRYWTGLLLLLRFLMLFVATITNISNPQDPYSNLLIILVVSSGLLLWSWIVGRLYKKWYHNLLEGSFIFNLVVLAGGTYQVRQSGGNQAALVYTSVSIALLTFTGIVFSAVVKQVKQKVAVHRRRAGRYQASDSPNFEEDSVQLVAAAAPTSAATYSALEIVRHHPDQTTGEINLRAPTGDESPDSIS